MPAHIMQLQSAIIVIIMLVGITQHRKRLLHKKIMLTAIIWDIILILQVELSRGAILKASKAMTNPMLLNIHVSIAVSTVVFYVFMLITGQKLIKGQQALLPKHRWLGRITFLMRVLTLITSFWAVEL